MRVALSVVGKPEVGPYTRNWISSKRRGKVYLIEDLLKTRIIVPFSWTNGTVSLLVSRWQKWVLLPLNIQNRFLIATLEWKFDLRKTSPNEIFSHNENNGHAFPSVCLSVFISLGAISSKRNKLSMTFSVWLEKVVTTTFYVILVKGEMPERVK